MNEFRIIHFLFFENIKILKCKRNLGIIFGLELKDSFKIGIKNPHIFLNR